jgi:heparanase 1
MAADYHNLAALLVKYWPTKKIRPLLIGNDCNSNPGFLAKWLPKVADVLDVVTYHHYDGYGLDPKLPQEMMSNKFLDGTRQKSMADLRNKLAPHAQLWVGEAAAAWHSGGVGVTNAFVSSFWYADALAGQSVMNHSGYCRQTLIGGELLPLPSLRLLCLHLFISVCLLFNVPLCPR